MNKKTKMSVILSILLIFLSAVVAQEAQAKPFIRYEIVVKAFTAGAPKCPHGKKPLNGVRVYAAVQLIFRVSAHRAIFMGATIGESSGTTGTEEVEREVEKVDEKGKKVKVKEKVKEEGRFTARGYTNMEEVKRRMWTGNMNDFNEPYLESLLDSEREMRNVYNWSIGVLYKCPSGDHPHPSSQRVTMFPDKITGSGKSNDPYVIRLTANLYCSCKEPEKKVGALIAPSQRDQATAVAVVTVKEEEKVQVAREIGGQAVASVVVNDELREPPKPDEGITVNPGDVIQLISTVGSILGHFTFAPEEDIAPPPGATPVVESPLGKPSVVSVPGNYVGTPIENMAVTTGPIETAVAPGPEEVPAVTGPASATAVGGLEPILKTDDTVVAAGPLDNSAMGSNAISVIDKNTGAVLGQTQLDMWRLAGANLNPPMVKKGQDTNLRLNVFGPPDLQLEVTATAGEGLTPKQLTATAPISVLQSQGLGAFTATKAGTHSVSVKASPVMGLPAWR